MKKIIFIIVGIILLVNLALAVNNTIKLKDSEWTCIAEECSEFATGEKWIEQNCKLEENEMICEFQYEGEYFRVPLSGIKNIEDMVSCKEYACTTKVLISNSK